MLVNWLILMTDTFCIQSLDNHVSTPKKVLVNLLLAIPRAFFPLGVRVYVMVLPSFSSLEKPSISKTFKGRINCARTWFFAPPFC